MNIRDKLYSSFPKALKSDVEKVLQILPETKPGFFDLAGKSHELDISINDSKIAILLNNESLIIPYRINILEPDINKENQLTEIQRTILCCIYLRHSNGFIRQKRLEQLLNKSDYFIIPFTFELLGEYLIEILEVLDKHITGENIYLYQRFIRDNPEYWWVTKCRIVSYWNQYYRFQFPKIKDYIGKSVVDRIEVAKTQPVHNKKH